MTGVVAVMVGLVGIGTVSYVRLVLRRSGSQWQERRQLRPFRPGLTVLAPLVVDKPTAGRFLLGRYDANTLLATEDVRPRPNNTVAPPAE